MKSMVQQNIYISKYIIWETLTIFIISTSKAKNVLGFDFVYLYTIY